MGILLSIILTAVCPISFAEDNKCQPYFSSSEAQIEEVQSTWLKMSPENASSFENNKYQHHLVRLLLRHIENEQLTRASIEILNLANNKEAWVQYADQLLLEANSNPSSVIKIKNYIMGKNHSRDLILRVLVARSKARKELPLIKTDEYLSNEEFSQLLRRGPFIDITFGTADHGSDTHFVQRDFYSPVVQKHFPDNPNQFYELLAENIQLWKLLFDSPRRNINATSPEFLRLNLLIEMGLE